MIHFDSKKLPRVKRPQTNGKAEWVIRTILEQWLYKNTFYSREERRKSLQQFIYQYNEKRPHHALKVNGQKMTPCQIIQNYVKSKV